MKKLTKKGKRTIIVTAVVIVAVTVLLEVGFRLEPFVMGDHQPIGSTSGAASDSVSSSASSGSTISVPAVSSAPSSAAISVPPIVSQASASSQPDTFVPGGSDASTNLTEIEKPTSTPPPPPPPSSSALTNKDTPPKYESKPESKPAATSKAPEKPSGGKPGQIYVDGFGWIDDEGGGTQTEHVDGNWGSGSQIGIMD